MLVVGIRETKPTNLGYKKTGGEILTRLDAFDVQQDSQVEVLHTMMLAVTKYIVNDLCDFLAQSEVQQLESRLRNYQSKAFNRTMNTSMRLHRSFVGRDF